MRSGPRARGASCPDLITFNRHLKLDQGPTIHAAASCAAQSVLTRSGRGEEQCPLYPRIADMCSATRDVR